MNIQDIINWCDKHAENGEELAINWEGGGDSGWVYFTIDGESCTEPEAEYLVDKMHDELDYGSWAGEYSANGSATYDPESKSFDGVDWYSEEEYRTHELQIPIEFTIPKKYYFEVLRVELENVIEEGNVTISANTRNGFINEELVALVSDLEKSLVEKIEKAFDEELPSIERSGYQTVRYDEKEIEEASTTDPDNYVFKIEELEYITQNDTDTAVSISLTDLLEMLRDTEL